MNAVQKYNLSPNFAAYKMRAKHVQQGFYLLILVVLVLIAIRLFRTQSYSEKYRLAAHNIVMSYNAWRDYYNRYGRYPGSFEDILKGVDVNSKIFIDPFSSTRNFLRVMHSDDGNIYIYSVGPNGVDDGLRSFVIYSDWELSGDFCIVVRDSHTNEIIPMPLLKKP